jgi:four helix bundle protein
MLRIHDVVLQLIAEVAPLAVAIGRHDADLAKQLRRALSSVALNVAEGSGQRGARRGSHYSIALGSARESWSALRVAAAWGYVPEPPPHERTRFDHVIGTPCNAARR